MTNVGVVAGAVLLSVATLSQLVPVSFGVASDRLKTSFRRAIALWGLVLFVGDSLYLMVAVSRGPNLWLGYIVPPTGSALGLWALSLAHPDPLGRTAIRIAIPLQIAVGALLTLTIEDARTFSLAADPFHSVVVLLAALWTFLRLGFRETDGMATRDWFWTLVGIMLYSGTTMALQPVSWFLRSADRLDLLAAAYHARAVAEILAFLLITWGVACPLQQRSSGGYS